MKRLILCFLIMLFTASFSFTSSAQMPDENSEYYFDYGVIYLLNYETGEAMVLGGFPDGIDYQNMPHGTDSILDIKANVNGCRVTSILEYAFQGRQDLKTVMIPATVVNIGEQAFAGSNIQAVYLYNDYGSSEEGFSIGSLAFSECARLESVLFSNSPVNEIGEGAFNKCYMLKNAYFDDYSPITTLSRGCFNCCSSLTSFGTPVNVTTIDNAAFAGCTSLNYVYMPNGLTTIGRYAFAECSSLTSIYLFNGIQTIDEAAFMFSGLTSVNIPNSVTYLGGMAFAGCRDLKTLKLSNAITDIRSHAFAGCYALTSISIPNSVKTIGDRAFAGSEFRGAYNTDYIYPGLGIMQEDVYSDLGSIETINIGSSLETVGQYAFVGHPLQSVTVMAPIPPVLQTGIAIDNPTVFDTDNFGTATLYVPRAMVNAYQTAHEWELFTNIEGFEVLGNGDVNNDNVSNVSDITDMINSLLNEDTSNLNLINADLNGDGIINVTDITILVNNVLAAH